MEIFISEISLLLIIFMILLIIILENIIVVLLHELQIPVAIKIFIRKILNIL
jgi:hypothetical protein